MSKFTYKCGNTIKISGVIPNPQEILFIPDTDCDLFEGNVHIKNV